jgi:hypothetical protein
LIILFFLSRRISRFGRFFIFIYLLNLPNLREIIFVTTTENWGSDSGII